MTYFAERGAKRTDQSGWRRQIKAALIKFDDEAKAKFLEHFVHFNRLGIAAKAAGVCSETVRNHLKDDPEFAAAYEQAKAEYADKVHDLGWTLMNGVLTERPIIGGKDRDEVIATVKEIKHAEGLVAMELRRTNPEYKDRSEVDLKGSGGGVLVVPADMSVDDWIKQQQEKNAVRADPRLDDGKQPT